MARDLVFNATVRFNTERGCVASKRKTRVAWIKDQSESNDKNKIGIKIYSVEMWFWNGVLYFFGNICGFFLRAYWEIENYVENSN
jgi:hypothetical protein